MKLSLFKFKKHGPHLFLQQAIAVIYIAFILFFLSLVDDGSKILWAIGSGALSSSCYIVFVTPKSPIANSKRIIGGYFVGIIIGLLMHVFLTKMYNLTPYIGHFHTSHIFWISAAITVGISLIAMVILGVEHPPAVGISLVLVLHLGEYTTLLMIFISAVILAFIHWLLKNWLVNLI
jgi:CBS domain-containing membrane protein